MSTTLQTVFRLCYLTKKDHLCLINTLRFFCSFYKIHTFNLSFFIAKYILHNDNEKKTAWCQFELLSNYYIFCVKKIKKIMLLISLFQMNEGELTFISEAFP
jgi:hypothetical protein